MVCKCLMLQMYILILHFKLNRGLFFDFYLNANTGAYIYHRNY